MTSPSSSQPPTPSMSEALPPCPQNKEICHVLVLCHNTTVGMGKYNSNFRYQLHVQTILLLTLFVTNGIHFRQCWQQHNKHHLQPLCSKRQQETEAKDVSLSCLPGLLDVVDVHGEGESLGRFGSDSSGQGKTRWRPSSTDKVRTSRISKASSNASIAKCIA